MSDTFTKLLEVIVLNWPTPLKIKLIYIWKMFMKNLDLYDHFSHTYVYCSFVE